MDALILTCGTGGGHNAAAQAMQTELVRRGHNVTIMNPYELHGEKLVKMIDQGYIQLVQKAPWGFGAIYRIGDTYRRLPFRSPVYYVNRKMEKKMEAFLKEHHFDIVLMTHLFPAEIFTNLIDHGKVVPKTMLIATDYACIPFMEETKCDAYVIPSKELKYEFMGYGIDEKRIYPLGIPVHCNYEDGLSRKKAMEELGMDTSKRYILLSGGSMGAGSLEKVLDAMIRWAKPNDAIRFVVVCGSNEAMYKRFQKKYTPQNVRVVGYTTRMHLYLKASALYVTKPGGLSSTEAAVMGVPILHVSPIPGCETYNARYFEEHGMSLALTQLNLPQICNAMRTLGWNEMRRQMVAQQKKCIPAGAAGRIAALAEKMVSKD